jgi:hypothetical protein
MPNNIPISNNSKNLEVIYRILKAVAKKYDCGFEYNADDNSLKFTGPEEYHKHIIQEMLSFFNK